MIRGNKLLSLYVGFKQSRLWDTTEIIVSFLLRFTFPVIIYLNITVNEIIDICFNRSYLISWLTSNILINLTKVEMQEIPSESHLQRTYFITCEICSTKVNLNCLISCMIEKTNIDLVFSIFVILST